MAKKNKKLTIDDLKEVSKMEKTAFIKKEKELSLGTVTALKNLRIFVWIFVVFILVLGILQLVRSKKPKIIENIYKEDLSLSQSNRATSFAESFVKDYLTFGDIINKDDYRTKILSYVSDGLNFNKSEIINGYFKVTDTFIWNVEKIDENRSNITIKAIVEIQNKDITTKQFDETGQEVYIPKTEEKTYYVEVPILIKENKVVVNDYPTFKAIEEKLQEPLKGYIAADNQIAANDAEKREVNNLLNDFFTTYYGGTIGQITSFFKTKSDIKSIGNEFVFNSIKSTEIYKKDKIYTVIAVVEIKHKEMEINFIQQFLLEIEETSDKLLILNLKNRIE